MVVQLQGHIFFGNATTFASQVGTADKPVLLTEAIFERCKCFASLRVPAVARWREC